MTRPENLTFDRYIKTLAAELNKIGLTLEEDSKRNRFIAYGGEYIVGEENEFPEIAYLLRNYT